MKNKSSALLLFYLLPFVLKADPTSDKLKMTPVDWVNTLMGTLSKPSLSNGNTYPAVCVPWGMNTWTPQTGPMGDGWIYRYDADKIRGFKQTHQPSPWNNDYGQFSLMPGTGKAVFEEDERASWFSHKSEIAKPDYYSVYLADEQINVELTPTERAAFFKFTYQNANNAHLIVDAFDKGSYVKILPEENKVIGYTTRNSGGVPANFKNYFVLTFSHPFKNSDTWLNDKWQTANPEATGNHAGAALFFDLKAGETLEVKVASSFISTEQANINLGEIGQASFETIRQKARNSWNEILGRLVAEGGSEEQMRTFYSCLYRAVQFPRKFYEIDANGQAIHYSPFNGQVLPGELFTDTGFWDTFRALFPLLNLVYPDIAALMQKGLVNTVREGGWLPEWASPGYRQSMIGNNSASIVAEAYLKGIDGFDIETLYAAMVKGTLGHGPVEAVGRHGANYYNQQGYVPYNVKINENAARTLEYAYADYAIYKLAEKLKKPVAEIELYKKRSQYYRNVFDAETRLMRGRNKEGDFQKPFNAVKWGDAFTEGNSWHYSWSVFHDIEGLVQLMGGATAFAAKLDSVLKMLPEFDASYYGHVIHEIREMQIADMGQYAHGNQPIQHMLYLYNYVGQPWQTQHWVRQTMNRMYHSKPDGYCGDEDNGQTSAWYIFSAMGFYPVCPVNNEYVLGTPQFKKLTIHLPNGKKILIDAPANSAENVYVQRLKVNDGEWKNNWISHETLAKGAHLLFEQSNEPNKERGTQKTSFPQSMTKVE